MTILDLINKSVTDEEMPEKVKYDGYVYEYRKAQNDYSVEIAPLNFLFENTRNYLDDVEIVEEEIETETETAEERKLKALDEFVSKLREIE